MSVCLGLDTSNYTTSAAIWQDGAIHQVKRLLPVKPGELGLRQSDAVFHHVRQLPDIVEELRGLCDAPITAIAASDRPQQREGSYMPCFLAGMGAARELAAVLHVPCYRFTHQQSRFWPFMSPVGRPTPCWCGRTKRISSAVRRWGVPGI